MAAVRTGAFMLTSLKEEEEEGPLKLLNFEYPISMARWRS
jgi:hypothetical protein